MYNDITAAILSGGKSSRMGENKSLMRIGNRSVIERIAELMRPLFGSVIIITNEPDEYSFLDLDTFGDIYPGRGPLAGIHSALVNSYTAKCFIMSCDIPLMKSEMIDYIVNYPTDKQIVVARASGFIQQLCGIYSKSCLAETENILSLSDFNEKRAPQQTKRRCSVLELIDRTGAEIINAEELPFYTEDLFFNMNRKEEFEYVKTRLLMVPGEGK